MMIDRRVGLILVSLAMAAVLAEGQDGQRPKRRGYLGVSTGEIAPEERERLGLAADEGGVKISNVTEESAAERAGLKIGDVILKLDATKIVSMETLSGTIQSKGAGTEVTIAILRDGKRIEVKATLGTHPSERAFADEWPPKPSGAEPVPQLAAKCGTQIPWISAAGTNAAGAFEEAKRKAVESKRLILWYAFRIPGVHIQRYTLLDRYMLTGPFADMEVAELARRKFVALRLASVDGVGDAYGLRALDVMEPALVFLKPDGTLVHKMDRLRSITPEYILNAMRLVLDKAPEFNAPTAKGAGLDLAAEQILDGDYAAASKTIGEDASGRAMLLRGVLHRRQFQADEALKALARAKELLKGDPEPLAEEALVLFKSGRVGEAKAAYEALLRDHPKASRAAEATYRLGECEYLSAAEPRAAGVWKRLVDASPDSPWAWKAAAHLNKRSDCYFGESGLTHCYEDPLWPVPEALKGLLPGSEFPRTEGDVEDIGKRAVRFLLRHQRSNGSWSDSRYIFEQGPVILPNVWTSITSMACAALLEWRHVDPAAVDLALGRAMPYLRDEKNMSRGKFETSYADAFRILYFARRIAAVPAEKEKLLEAINDLTKKLEEQQVQGGFWWHEYPNPFITGMVLYVLAQAKAAGAKVPEEAVARGIAALKGVRSAAGTYPYYTRGRSSGKDSSGRAPLNELALLMWGEGSKEAVDKALQLFFEHHARLDRVRKSDYHSDGELAGFFYFHSFLPATDAARAVGGEKGDEHLKRLLAILVKMPEVDGSFAEDHEIGKSYATAMALLSLKNCRSTGGREY